MIQLCIIKIIGYGPWTLTLGSDREHILQMLQASLYKNLQESFSEKNCLVFVNRADEFFAVTNGLDIQGHEKIKKRMFDPRTKLSFSIGCSNTPYEANLAAYEARKVSQLNGKNDSVCGEACDGDFVTIMHLDIDNFTKSQKKLSPYDTTSTIFSLYAYMSEFFMAKKSLSFFMGGDNFMIVSSPSAKESVAEFISKVKKERGITLNCGIGTAKRSRQAACLATESLDTIRKMRDSNGKNPRIYELPCS
ncbi:MAG: GTP cyclohydrolase [Cenarchaeum symbiont of Oopsacas minuta]|nr:GTP cyclohydrolase [Cenarchaeum symbiont of Oopsacas minuta]